MTYKTAGGSAWVCAALTGWLLASASCITAMAPAQQEAEKEKAVRFINLPARSDQLPYSNAVSAGDTLYLAGSIGVDPATDAPPAAIEDEVRIVMDSMRQRLQMAGMEMKDLVWVQVFCSDVSLYDQFNAVYRTYFKDHFPARAFVGSGPLLRGGHFEVMGIAVKP